MEIIEVLKITKVGDPNIGFHVLVDSDGWWHVAKLPPTPDNIFFSLEELEVATGEQLVISDTKKIYDLSDHEKDQIKKWLSL